MFPLPSPSSLLNPPNILEPGTGCRSPCALYCKRTKHKTNTADQVSNVKKEKQMLARQALCVDRKLEPVSMEIKFAELQEIP